ncbi:GNAT family N-acetyltransferase [Nocardioides panacis]|uniref:GNAT family N-acetyltransferase n=1 Tax=Nocardioides panacis TaxID=2849501 RepID=A0A975SWN5_9ACTN|nr:GNAT family N-acetyltransferase [Nocardioides panacis]QWZ06840.1 GNAT family N-acetyltransferase [Nocardioides panacis]
MTTATFPEAVPVLTDGVVTLRAHHAGDVDGVLEQCLDPVSRAWTTVPVDYTREQAEGFVGARVPAAWAAGSWVFAVEATDDTGVARFCGTVELRHEGDARAEIAYGAHPWARGRGIVHRALELLLAWGFEEQGLQTVIWWANRGNWASRRAAWRLGFTLEGTVPQWLPQRGVLRDAWVGVLRAGDERAPRTDWLVAHRVEGEKVVLRPWRLEDAERVVQACTDERTRHWLWRLPDPYTRPDAEDYLASRVELLATGAGVGWAVADARTDELLGSIALFDLTRGRDAEIGYWAHPDARGRGVMSEGCALAVRHAFASADDGGLGLQRLQVSAAEGNAASQRVIAANGFVRTGRERRSLRLGDGSLTDCVTYDLLAEEYAGTASAR